MRVEGTYGEIAGRDSHSGRDLSNGRGYGRTERTQESLLSWQVGPRVRSLERRKERRRVGYSVVQSASNGRLNEDLGREGKEGRVTGSGGRGPVDVVGGAARGTDARP